MTRAAISAPLTHYADPAEMAAWIAHAPPRAVLIYASGPNLAGGQNPAAVLARQWKDEGRAALFSTRSQRRAGCFDYCAKKLSRDMSETARVDAALFGEGVTIGGLPPAWQEAPEGALYAHLAELAQAGAACPSDGLLAEALGWANARAVQYRRNNLERVGAVRVIGGARFGARVIEIAATGERTR